MPAMKKSSLMGTRLTAIQSIAMMPTEMRKVLGFAIGKCECGAVTAIIGHENSRTSYAEGAKAAVCSECSQPASFEWCKPTDENGDVLPLSNHEWWTPTVENENILRAVKAAAAAAENQSK